MISQLSLIGSLEQVFLLAGGGGARYQPQN